ncbi:MAG: zf-HC2 domain-containing protein [Candidatus Dormibacteraeota bacterium]|nr:zf-HC2 domain-containing protein [Candidatus Dormibacteraeota bacterium]
MKCSLLTLSTFIDGELASQRGAEVDAHLVGCARCSAGAATLREEKTRVGQLARVTVDAGSAQMMLEQVGISIDSVVDAPVIPPPPAAPFDERRPWQAGASSPALPWIPRRPEPVAQEMAMPTMAPDVQPDLPLDGVRSTPPSWDRAPVGEPALSPEVDVAAIHPDPSGADADLAEADRDWLSAAMPPESWEEDLPPLASPSPPAGEPAPPTVARTPPAGIVEPLEPPPPPVAAAPPHRPAPPRRVAPAAGPAALWTRMRDAVAVRLALARSGEALEDSMQIVSGAPSRRGATLPAPVHTVTADVVAGTAATPPQAPPAPAAEEVELHGFAGHSRSSPAIVEPEPDRHDAPDPVADRRARPRADVSADRDIAGLEDPAGWNAFAASSYRDADVPADKPTPRAPRPLGRHSRAVAREQVPLSTRITRAIAAVAALARGGASTAVARARQGVAGISETGPDNRLLAGVAGIGLIFVLALLFGRGSSHPVPPTANRPATSAAIPPRQSTPAQSSAAAGASGASAPSQVQTFGAGDTGFQVVRLRYGAQSAYYRVVFDFAGVRGAGHGTPEATVAFSTPATVLVTFAGTVPAGSTGTPTLGKVISSVSLVSSSGNKTVYRFTLTRAATATAFYLVSPTRFVLDLH